MTQPISGTPAEVYDPQRIVTTLRAKTHYYSGKPMEEPVVNLRPHDKVLSVERKTERHSETSGCGWIELVVLVERYA